MMELSFGMIVPETRIQILFDKLESLGFKRLAFEGLKPGDRSVDETSVFYRVNNCIGL